MRGRAVCGSLLSSPKKDSPAWSVRRFVPRRSIVASSSAWLEAEMPRTATIDAMPIATPSAESAARSRRVRSPMLPTARTSRGSRRLGSSARSPPAAFALRPARAAPRGAFALRPARATPRGAFAREPRGLMRPAGR